MQIFPRYRNHFLRGQGGAPPYLAGVKIYEVVDADQSDRHPPAAPRTHLAPGSLLITDKNLRSSRSTSHMEAVPEVRRVQSSDLLGS